MSYKQIVLGETEPIKIFVVDAAGVVLTGKTDLYVRIQRSSDGQFLDWSDNQFKAAGHTTIEAALTEVGFGIYELTGGFDSSLVINLGETEDLNIIPIQTPGTDARLPSPEELQVRVYNLASLEDTLLAVKINVDRALGLLHENSIVDNQVYDGGQLESARLRVFDSAANLPGVPGGSETVGLLFEYAIQAGYSEGLLNEFKIARVT